MLKLEWLQFFLSQIQHFPFVINHVHKKPIPDEEKCLILMTLLTDDANRAKSRVVASWYGYTTIINRLEQYYGGQMRELQRCVDVLDNLQTCKPNDLTALRELLDIVQEINYVFIGLGMESDFDHPLIYAKLYKLIPRSYRQQFDERLEQLEFYMRRQKTKGTCKLVGKQVPINKKLHDKRLNKINFNAPS